MQSNSRAGCPLSVLVQPAEWVIILGAALGAIVATRFGVEACLWVVAAGFLIQLLVICVSRVPKLEALPLAS